MSDHNDIVVNVSVDSGCVEIGFGSPFSEAADKAFFERCYGAVMGNPSLHDGRAMLLKTRHGDGFHRVVICLRAMTRSDYTAGTLSDGVKEYVGTRYDLFACNWYVGDCGLVSQVVPVPKVDVVVIYRSARSFYLYAVSFED